MIRRAKINYFQAGLRRYSHHAVDVLTLRFKLPVSLLVCLIVNRLDSETQLRDRNMTKTKYAEVKRGNNYTNISINIDDDDGNGDDDDDDDCDE